MALVGSVKPFGIRDIKITNLAGTTQVDLPNAQTMTFTERLTTGEMRGDDATQAVVAFTDALEWELEAGGISLEAYALMTGRTITLSGTTPNQVNTLAGNAGDVYPYFKIYGKSQGDGADDIHVKILKAKLTGGFEGEFKDGEFWVTKCSGIAVDPGAGNLFEIIQNESATTLPTT